MHQFDVECRTSQLLIHHGHDYHQHLPLSDVIIAFHHGQWMQEHNGSNFYSFWIY